MHSDIPLLIKIKSVNANNKIGLIDGNIANSFEIFLVG